jgi:hypothetical protein
MKNWILKNTLEERAWELRKGFSISKLVRFKIASNDVEEQKKDA